ncbi:hypothetical protein J6590_060960 [Homalodisca vitripennis]|nr:hypothetical protein J6590_060960 [Homalodisca vitripennis]
MGMGWTLKSQVNDARPPTMIGEIESLSERGESTPCIAPSPYTLPTYVRPAAARSSCLGHAPALIVAPLQGKKVQSSAKLDEELHGVGIQTTYNPPPSTLTRSSG